MEQVTQDDAEFLVSAGLRLQSLGQQASVPVTPVDPHLVRQINAAGLSSLEFSEGVRLDAYHDQAGIWTIGVGHAYGLPASAVAAGWPLRPVKITQAMCDWLLRYDLTRFEEVVNDAAPSATDNQFAAMVCLAYNIGPNAFLHSTVLRKHQAGDFAGAADAFLMWDKTHVDGQLVTVAGLRDRRERERALYLTP